MIQLKNWEVEIVLGQTINVKGSLRRNIDKRLYENGLDMIENGYKVPFIETPSSKVLLK